MQSNQLLESNMRVNLSSGFVTGGGYLGFPDGFEQLPHRLAEKFIERGGRVFLNHALLEFHEHNDDDEFHLMLIDPNLQREVKTQVKQLILAIAPPALQRMVDKTNILFPSNELGRRNLEAVFSVHPYNAVKAFVSFKDAWWKKLGNDRGRISTDLPSRQLFYWDEGDQGALMMMYCDEKYDRYWVQKGTDHEHDYVLPPRHGKVKPMLACLLFHRCVFILKNYATSQYHGPVFECSDEIRRELLNQIREVHGDRIDPSDIPEPEMCVYSDWRVAPYYGSWNWWRTNVSNQEIIGILHAPIPGKRIHIINEGWSDFQGWVEGGLRTAESFLHDYMDMKAPSFMEEEALQSYLCLNHPSSPRDDDDDDDDDRNDDDDNGEVSWGSSLFILPISSWILLLCSCAFAFLKL